MTVSSNSDHPFAPRAFLLLPVAVALHIAEEWFGGFTDWARLTLEIDIETAQFLSVNLVGLVLFTFGAAFAYLEPRAAWIGVSLTALVCLNAIVQASLSVAFGVYSPGTITGVLLYVPLSVIIFRWAATHLSRAGIGAAVLLGIGVHAVATLSATL
ncbi:MAG: HXXEE domain-containing protein [Rhodothermales bacterium]